MTTWKEFKETMEAIEKAECWNDFDTEVYEGLCEFAGLDYHKYDDPDKLWTESAEDPVHDHDGRNRGRKRDLCIWKCAEGGMKWTT